MADEPVLPQTAKPPASALSPAARQQAVDVLTRSYAADRLADSDFQARLDLVYRAMTPTDLEAALAELPAAPQDRAPAAARADTEVHAFMSGQEQRFTGVLPRRISAKARLGYVELDLSAAALQEGVTEIDVRALMGYVEIRLPPGVRVEVTGRALLGYFALKGEAPEEDSTRILRISGRAIMGYSECYRTHGRAIAAPAQGQLTEGAR